MKHRQSQTKAGEIQPAWFQEKFHPDCTAWLDPEGRDGGNSSRGLRVWEGGELPSSNPCSGQAFWADTSAVAPTSHQHFRETPEGLGKKRQVAPWSDTSAGLSLGSQTPLPYYSQGWRQPCALRSTMLGDCPQLLAVLTEHPPCAWWGSKHHVGQLKPQHPGDCLAQQQRKEAERSHTAF